MNVAWSDFVPRTGHSNHRAAQVLVIHPHGTKHRSVWRTLRTFGDCPTPVFEFAIGHNHQISLDEKSTGYHSRKATLRGGKTSPLWVTPVAVCGTAPSGNPARTRHLWELTRSRCAICR